MTHLKFIKTFLLVICFALIFSISFSQNIEKIDSIKIALKQAKHDSIKTRLLILLADKFLAEKPDSALKYYKKALQLSENNLSNSFSNIFLKYKNLSYFSSARAYRSLGQYDEAINYYLKSIDLYTKQKDKIGISKSYTNIGIVYEILGNYDKSIKYYFKALKVFEEINDKYGTAVCYINIGNIFWFQNNYKNAIMYFEKSLKLFQELQNKYGESQCYNNMGSINYNQNKFQEAKKYFLKSLMIFEELNDKNGLALSYGNLGSVLSSLGNYIEAEKYLQKSLKINEELQDKYGIVSDLNNIAGLHIFMADSSAKTQVEKNYHLQESVKLCEQAMTIATGINVLPKIKDLSFSLIKSYKKLGNTAKSLHYSEVYIATTDSMFKEEKTKALADAEKKYQSDKKQKEIELLEKDKKLQNAEIKRQTLLKYAFIAGFLFVLILLGGAILSYRKIRAQKNMISIKNEELHQQNEEIKTQRDEIESQRDEISSQRDLVTKQKDEIEYIHEELKDSIHYAQRIQKAVLPPDEFIKSILPECFILFKPKDIVSGDFYWITKKHNYIFIAVADCTGHGVPGGFMSMLGISFLNEIIIDDKIKTAGQILDELRNYVVKSLQQKGIAGEQKDGMDIAFIALNTETNILQFAGANNPLWLICSQGSVSLSEVEDNNKIHSSTMLSVTEIKGDKMPVAIYENMKPFANHVIQLQKGDTIYLMSDGFEDQFGGPKGKKIYSKNVKDLLTQYAHLSMDSQKEILNKTIEDWIYNYPLKFEQTDDINVMGIRI